MKSQRKASIVLLSGGPDSTTLALDKLETGPVIGVHVMLGNATSTIERRSAQLVARHTGIRLEIADLSDSFNLFPGTEAYGEDPELAGISSWCGGPLVRGLYVVGLSLAVSYANAVGSDEVALAIHDDDIDAHPEFSRENIEKLIQALEVANGRRVEIKLPYAEMSKAKVFDRARELDAPLSLSWSCVIAGQDHCGACDPCRRRHDAFRSSEQRDPTRYAKNPENQE